jgi:hypothetical protein
MLPFPGMVRVVSGAWARADIEALDINATVAAAMTPDRGLGAVIETSCDHERLLATSGYGTLPAPAYCFGLRCFVVSCW